ncbi:cytochrome P450 [Glonium stellatum]|uniref:Cytochrome P450 n=1 Tax=Glonium stellatum TaxID=574774 RepID=A0A8E2F308_9PEZI|nr:cytochrome P450 [Glonium stellatum]
MVSARSFFLGVNGSNKLIKHAFIPVCSLFLLSPFFLLLARALRIDITAFLHIPEAWRTPAALSQIFLSLIAITFSTRIISGNRGSLSTESNGAKKVPIVPYWIPVFRHFWQYIWSDEDFLSKSRDSSTHGIFAYNLVGTTHNVVCSPSLVKAVFSHPEFVSEVETNMWMVPKNAMGMPENAKNQYFNARPIISKSFIQYFLSGPSMNDLIGVSIQTLQENLPDLITFNQSIVDQMPWERVSDVELTDIADGHTEVEANLLSLINDFLGQATLAPFTGPSFIEKYPEVFLDLQRFEYSFFLLAAGIPRWFPVPHLTSSYLARKRLLNHLTELHLSLSRPDTADTSEVPGTLEKLNQIQQDQNLSPPARASSTLRYLHVLSGRSAPLAFWLLLLILSYKSSSSASGHGSNLLDRIRVETSAYVSVTQPPSINPNYSEPPRITINIEDLAAKCPLLRSCLLETLRLYSAPLSAKVVTRDFTITESASDAGSAAATPSTWQLRKGEHIDVGLGIGLHCTDPRYWVDPLKWIPERHLNLPDTRTAEEAQMHGLPNMTPTDLFTSKVVVAFVASVIQLWDFEPAGQGKTWQVPKAGVGSAIKSPKRDVRVKIRKRELKISS